VPMGTYRNHNLRVYNAKRAESRRLLLNKLFIFNEHRARVFRPGLAEIPLESRASRGFVIYNRQRGSLFFVCSIVM
jgi:hypothetical protein